MEGDAGSIAKNSQVCKTICGRGVMSVYAHASAVGLTRFFATVFSLRGTVHEISFDSEVGI